MQKKQQQQRRGVVAVEFAFMAPMLLAIVLGLIELTRVYDAQYLLQTAAREGARFASMDRDGMLGDGRDLELENHGRCDRLSSSRPACLRATFR